MGARGAVRSSIMAGLAGGAVHVVLCGTAFVVVLAAHFLRVRANSVSWLQKVRCGRGTATALALGERLT